METKWKKMENKWKKMEQKWKKMEMKMKKWKINGNEMEKNGSEMEKNGNLCAPPTLYPYLYHHIFVRYCCSRSFQVPSRPYGTQMNS